MTSNKSNTEDFLEENPTARVGMICLILLQQTVAYLLCPLIIWYEKYGEDPMKRTILNQLFSNNLIIVVCYNLIPSNFFLVRLIFGAPLNYNFTFAFFFIFKSMLGIAGLISILEYNVLRFLTICIWKRLPPFDELFGGIFLKLLNFTLALFLSCIQNFVQIGPDFMVEFMTGQNVDKCGPSFR